MGNPEQGPKEARKAIAEILETLEDLHRQILETVQNLDHRVRALEVHAFNSMRLNNNPLHGLTTSGG